MYHALHETTEAQITWFGLWGLAAIEEDKGTNEAPSSSWVGKVVGHRVVEGVGKVVKGYSGMYSKLSMVCMIPIDRGCPSQAQSISCPQCGVMRYGL